MKDFSWTTRWCALLSLAAVAALDTPEAYVDVSHDGGNTFPIQFWAQPATFGQLLPDTTDAVGFAAFLADDSAHFGCSNVSALPQTAVATKVLVASRGNCSFAQKAFNAQLAGATAIIIYDGMVGKYTTAMSDKPAGTPLQTGPCDTNCAAGSFTVNSQTVSDMSQVYAGFPGVACTAACGAGSLCALPAPPGGAVPPDGSRQACCVPNDLLIMGAGGADTDILSQLSIPAAFISASDGATLLRLMGYQPMRDRPGEWARALASAVPRELGAAGSHADGTVASHALLDAISSRLRSAAGSRQLGSLPARGPNSRDGPASATSRAAGARRREGLEHGPMTVHQAAFGLHSAGRRQQRRVLTSAGPGDSCSSLASVEGPAGVEPTDATGTGTAAVAGSTNAQLDSSAFAPMSAPLPSTVVLRPAFRPVPVFDAASLIIWALGVFTTGLAAYLSVGEERARFKAALAGVDGEQAVAALPQRGGPQVSLNPRQAYYALGFAAIVLLTLYLLVHYGVPVVYIVMTLFSVGAWQASATVYFYPLLDRFVPNLDTKVLADLGSWGVLTASWCIAHTCSLILVAVWLAERHAPGAFILQDMLGIALCCTFLAGLRLPNVRTAAILLGLFFAYDIFMVFITPYIFGSSVMIDVATAGMPVASYNSACYCRLHPEDNSVCGPGESMPILLKIPRLNDWRGGMSMLGLGDIVVPGLAVSMAARRDWAPRGASARAAKGRLGYFPVLLGAYALGLALANVAVILTGLGQPALLYLVPCVLGAFVGMSRHLHEESEMWWGTAPGLTSTVDDQASYGDGHDGRVLSIGGLQEVRPQDLLPGGRFADLADSRNEAEAVEGQGSASVGAAPGGHGDHMTVAVPGAGTTGAAGLVATSMNGSEGLGAGHGGSSTGGGGDEGHDGPDPDEDRQRLLS